jgi:hypothetical protein
MADPLSVAQIDLIIDAAAQGLSEISIDGQMVRTRPLAELLKWRELAASREAVANGVSVARFTRIIPPGTA